MLDLEKVTAGHLLRRNMGYPQCFLVLETSYIKNIGVRVFRVQCLTEDPNEDVRIYDRNGIYHFHFIENENLRKFWDMIGEPC